MIIKIICFAILICLTTNLYPEDVSYSIEKIGKNPSYKATYITKKEKNHTVVTTDREQEKNKYHLTNGDISYWQHESKVKNIRFTLTKNNETIILKGTKGGKYIEKTYQTKKMLIQLIGIQLQPFFLTQKKVTTFSIISPTDFRMVTMKLKKQEEKTSLIDNKKIVVIQYNMSPTGLLGKLWKAKLFIEKNTAKMVRYEGPTGLPGSPKLIITQQ